MKKKSIFFVTICLIVLVSGCTDSADITKTVEQLPQVQQFMEEHPDATITVTYWSQEEVEAIQEKLSQDFGKNVTPRPMYKAVTSAGDILIITWIDAENQIVLYSHTENINLNKTVVIPNEFEDTDQIGFTDESEKPSEPVDETEQLESESEVQLEPLGEPELQHKVEAQISGKLLFNDTIAQGDGYQINHYVIDVAEVFTDQDSAIIQVYEGSNDYPEHNSLISVGNSFRFEIENEDVEITVISVYSGVVPRVKLAITVTDEHFIDGRKLGVVSGGHTEVEF